MAGVGRTPVCLCGVTRHVLDGCGAAPTPEEEAVLIECDSPPASGAGGGVVGDGVVLSALVGVS